MPKQLRYRVSKRRTGQPHSFMSDYVQSKFLYSRGFGIEDWAIDGEDDLPDPNYGTGLQVDLRTYLQDSARGRALAYSMDDFERFVLISYYVLRKPQIMMARELGLSENRFNQFLNNTVHKIGAMVAYDLLPLHEGERALEEAGCLSMEVREMLAGYPGKPGKQRVQVRTVDIISKFVEFRSFVDVGTALNLYYVDVRRCLEEIGEKLSKQKSLRCAALGGYVRAITQFASMRGRGYSGQLGKLDDCVERSDSSTLKESSYDLNHPDIDSVLYPRADFAF